MAKTKEQRSRVRVPLIPNQENRDYTASKDQRFVNCYLDIAKTALSDDKMLFLTKRPGISLYSSTTSGVGRGVWDFNGKIYHVTGNTLYCDNVAVKTLTAGLSTPCGATKILAPMEGLFFCDGFTAWVIHSDGTIEDVEKSANRWAASTTVAL